MNRKTCMLACSLGLSAMLFTGCATNNGGMTRNVRDDNRVGTYTADRNDRLFDRDMNNGTRVGEVGRDLGRTTRNLGENLTESTREFGRDLGETTRDLTGLNGTGRNGIFNNNRNGFGINGTTGVGMNGNGINGRGTVTGMNTRMFNRDVLMLGNLMIVGMSGKHNRDINGFTGMGNTGTNNYKVLKVTDRKAIDAIHRVNDSLNNNNAKAKAGTIASDIRYILKNATAMAGGR